VSAVTAAPTHSHEAYAERLYQRHHRAIVRYCARQLRRPDEADDAAQLTFIYALQSLRRGVVPQLELPWLLTIAGNVCSTRRRSGLRRDTHETPQDLAAVEYKLSALDRSDVATTDDFTAALRALPETQRRALLLREWRGLSYEEIGNELGLSKGATEALLFRARENAARRLDERVRAKTLHGLPLVSFVRDLFQTAAAKTLAVGAGAALAVVALPAAQLAPAVTVAPPRAVHQQAQRTHNMLRPVTAGRAPAQRGVDGQHPASRITAATTRVAPRDHRPLTRPAASAQPTTDSPESARQQQRQQSPSSDNAAAPPPATTPASGVVDTASEIAGSVDVPPVSLPVTPPATPTLPVAAPPTPPVRLP
jgi:RNA polymerase sigma factor (sigma-70 family)